MNITEFTQTLLSEITKYHVQCDGRKAAAAELSHIIKNLYDKEAAKALEESSDQSVSKEGDAVDES